MTISSLSAYQQARRQFVLYDKNYQPIQAQPVYDSACLNNSGNLGAIAAIGNTTSGVIPVGGNAGFPVLTNVSGTLYLDTVDVTCLMSGRFLFYDRLWHAGAFAFNSGTTTLSGQPSYASRVNSVYHGTQIWYEAATGTSSALTLTVTYTNQSGTTGKTTGAIAANTASVGGAGQFPLASGDDGVQKVESVTTSGGTSGTFNIFVARPLAIVRQAAEKMTQNTQGSDGGFYYPWAHAFPILYGGSNTAIALLTCIDVSTANTLFNAYLAFANG